MNRSNPLKTENLFHQILKAAKLRPAGEEWAVCVSGGMDSVTLLFLLAPIARMTKHPLSVYHIHHGEVRGQKAQNQFREGAYQFVRHLCKKLELNFYTNRDQRQMPAAPKKQDEASLRDFRWECLKRLTAGREAKHPVTFITGHHRDDVLETRLIHLIRGVGPVALAEFRASSPGVWRPFFHISKSQLCELALRQEWEWFEDPTNSKHDAFRNWIRLKWLPLLDKKRPGSRASLHRSLDLVIEALGETQSELKNEAFSEEKGTFAISRPEFEALSRQRQRQCLAQVVRAQGVRGYTKGQLDEVLKRLDSPKKRLQFTISQLLWKVDNTSITSSRV